MVYMKIDTPLHKIARDMVVCAIVAVVFICVWVLGQWIGQADGFLPFFFDGIFTVIGFLGVVAVFGWVCLPLSARGQIFPVLYK